jgi:hypothetical protein
VGDEAVLWYYMIEGNGRIGDMCNVVWREDLRWRGGGRAGVGEDEGERVFSLRQAHTAAGLLAVVRNNAAAHASAASVAWATWGDQRSPAQRLRKCTRTR